jgi:hypothetical protein
MSQRQVRSLSPAPSRRTMLTRAVMVMVMVMVERHERAHLAENSLGDRPDVERLTAGARNMDKGP